MAKSFNANGDLGAIPGRTSTERAIIENRHMAKPAIQNATAIKTLPALRQN